MNVLDRLDQLEQAATKGEWLSGRRSHHGLVVERYDQHRQFWAVIANATSDADAELIAFSRNHLRALIDVAKAASDHLDTLFGYDTATLRPLHDALAVLEQEAER